MEAHMQTKIFIDPGHGGRDPGAVGNGMKESDIVLEVAQILQGMLMRKGIDVALSRTADNTLSINERWQAANRWGADYFISIHVNAAGGNGAETFIAATKALQRDRAFAQAVNDTYAAAIGLRNRGVRLDTQTHVGSLGVLRHTNMPAILVELAFIDSPDGNPDVFILRNRRFDIAFALAKGILQYFEINLHRSPPPTFPISDKNLQAMIDLGVIETPEYWRTVDNVQWLNQLLSNAAQPGRLDKRIDNGITDLTSALHTLLDADILTTPDYWENLTQGENAVPWLDQLLINMANRSRDILERIVHAEARGEDLIGQILVGNVVMNRCRSPRFSDGIRNVVFQPHQFAPVGSTAYARAVPASRSDRTRKAVDQVLDGVDHSKGATFFRTVKGAEGSWHQENLEKLFDHGGHRFYREAQ
jgi:N-acetylmuramoyl-L-alanine amidase